MFPPWNKWVHFLDKRVISKATNVTWLSLHNVEKILIPTITRFINKITICSKNLVQMHSQIKPNQKMKVELKESDIKLGQEFAQHGQS